jgi:hypothetical protein
MRQGDLGMEKQIWDKILTISSKLMAKENLAKLYAKLQI